MYKIALDDQVSEAAYIPGRLYKPQPVMINGWSATGSSIQDVEFYFHQEQPRFEFFKVEEIKLRVYKDSRFTETVPLRAHQGFDPGYDEHIQEWAAEVNGLEHGTYEVYLEVIYRDGTEETFKVWPDIDEKARHYYR
ncbi:MAG: hypothetical protein FH749_13500 [Firmicutes bacterium]|nr:hypothetical protein [Bacillota bacterium]